jgi:hypothetical protein
MIDCACALDRDNAGSSIAAKTDMIVRLAAALRAAVVAIAAPARTQIFPPSGKGSKWKTRAEARRARRPKRK